MASYEFTTLTCIPGVVRYRGAKIQLLDLPGIIEGAKDGKGRGRQVRAPALIPTLHTSSLPTPALVTQILKAHSPGYRCCEMTQQNLGHERLGVLCSPG